MKMIFNYHTNKTYFHNKGFALSLVLKVRFFGTRKWPILIGRTIFFFQFSRVKTIVRSSDWLELICV